MQSITFSATNLPLSEGESVLSIKPILEFIEERQSMEDELLKQFFELLRQTAPQLMTGVVGIITAIIGYSLGRRSKVDDIRIKRAHELMEELAIVIQEDFHDRVYLRREYELNFGHLDSPAEAAHYFEQQDVMHDSMRKAMFRVVERRTKIISINQKCALFLPAAITEEVERYVELATLFHISDGINPYSESFFTDLLDREKSASREKLFKSIMAGLRKVK
jgi:hypothetical protein